MSREPANKERSERLVTVGGATAVVVGLMLCCVGPALLGAGALAALVGAVVSPWALVVVVPIAVAASVVAVRRYCRGRACRVDRSPGRGDRRSTTIRSDSTST